MRRKRTADGSSASGRQAAGQSNRQQETDGTLRPCSGWTEIFIYPGYQFKVLDCLITNFHLPESTLLMLVSALAGKEHDYGCI